MSAEALDIVGAALAGREPGSWVARCAIACLAGPSWTWT